MKCSDLQEELKKKYIIMTPFFGVEIIYNTICNKQ